MGRLSGQGRGKLSPVKPLRVGILIGQREGSSTGNGGCTKGTCRFGCIDLPGEDREGRRMPFFLRSVNFLGSKRVPPDILCLIQVIVHYMELGEDSQHDESGLWVLESVSLEEQNYRRKGFEY